MLRLKLKFTVRSIPALSIDYGPSAMPVNGPTWDLPGVHLPAGGQPFSLLSTLFLKLRFDVILLVRNFQWLPFAGRSESKLLSKSLKAAHTGRSLPFLSPAALPVYPRRNSCCISSIAAGPPGHNAHGPLTKQPLSGEALRTLQGPGRARLLRASGDQWVRTGTLEPPIHPWSGWKDSTSRHGCREN